MPCLLTVSLRSSSSSHGAAAKRVNLNPCQFPRVLSQPSSSLGCSRAGHSEAQGTPESQVIFGGVVHPEDRRWLALDFVGLGLGLVARGGRRVAGRL